MLGFSISQATVSRYLPAPGRRPKQSWRTFLRNQASAFGQYSAERSKGCAHLHAQSCRATRERSAVALIATSQQQVILSARRINLRSPQCDRGVTHRAAAVSGGSRRAPYDRSGVALSIRSPPQSRHNSSRRSLVGLTHLEIISYETGRPGELPCFRARGLGFEKAQPFRRRGQNPPLAAAQAASESRPVGTNPRRRRSRRWVLGGTAALAGKSMRRV
jgi:hypothetical protein